MSESVILRTTMPEAKTLSPMFRQYRALKEGNPGSILLFRMGDFYEMFEEDARVASRLLELTLTARGKGTANVIPMCGFPHHQLDSYTARLVRANQRVAICEQVEDPRQSKGLVKREVVRLITPGTVTDPALLDPKENIWLGAVAISQGRPALALLDLSTGEFLAWESTASGEAGWQALADRLTYFLPKELVYPEGFSWPDNFREERASDAVFSEADPFAFSLSTAVARLREQFDVATLDGFGFRDKPAALTAAGGLLQHLQDTHKTALDQIVDLRTHEPADHLLLDPSTRRNLELDCTLRDGRRAGSLFETIDMTVTAGGGRSLRSWLLAPLLDPERIAERQDAIEEFITKPDLRMNARSGLEGIHDIERLLTRAISGAANARELLGLRASLEMLPSILQNLSGVRAGLTRRTLESIDPCSDITQRLRDALVDEPPLTLKDGGVIRPGFNTELDELRTIQRDGKNYIAALQDKERTATGISSLKVRFNKVFGYFIEVTKSNLHLVPEHYHRKQTISTGERYITPELKEHEKKVLHAAERTTSLETELFIALRTEVASHVKRLKSVARATALLDTLSGLAELAALHDYRRPAVTTGPLLKIVAGRHPVVEMSLIEQRFVPNDSLLEAGKQGIAILTGPNMGGKSTYLRQVALIVLLAQTGSFVPAEHAEVGIFDRIFCRVGASDNLAEGQSTFMVEMTETANILHHATSRSLVLLDEIGRGTATFDGLSIAWAVVEQLDRCGVPRTIFATHYHELTELACELDSVINLCMAVREWGEGVTFLHRVEVGAGNRSYGIQVARLAGIPQTVVARATEILANLEHDEYGRDGLPRRARRSTDTPRTASKRQPSLFGLFEGDTDGSGTPTTRTETDVLAELRGREPDRLTPLDALQLITDWKRRLDGE